MRVASRWSWDDRRRDDGALAAAGLELPAVVAAGELVAVEPAVAEWDAAVGATVAHGEDAAVRFAAEDQRQVEEHGCGEGFAAELGWSAELDTSRRRSEWRWGRRWRRLLRLWW